ncbi:hypothetical protein PV02_06625 [Methanolobus chelungpuianus]|uniref:Archaeal flagella protein FlaD/E domain-containing protein n=2 Tax=Methanolobus chelungpuianus TaxID=502115 RepID=A0AAE3HAL9_9EURY|nr:hypothetical protein [Methanolobus chelungpuianus]
MEEVKVDVPSFGNKPEGQPAPFSPPSFRNGGDLSALLNKSQASDRQEPSGGPGQSTGPQFQLAVEQPFQLAQLMDIPPKKAGMPPLRPAPGTGQLPLSDVKHPTADKADPRTPQKVARRSPPPLFKLKMPGDESPETELLGTLGPGLSEAPAFNPISGTSASPEKMFKPSMPFEGAASVGPMSPFSSSLPEYVSPSPDPFKDAAPKNTDPFSSSSPADRLPFMQREQQGPFAGSPGSLAGPSTVQMPFQGSAFPDQGKPQNNPFASPFSPPVQLSPDSVQLPMNPFTGHAPPSSTHFPGPSPQYPNPSEASSASRVHFQASTHASFDPFAGTTHVPGGAFPGNATASRNPASLQGSSSLLSKAEFLKKNLEGAGTTLRSLFRGLVAGKSLLERMEEIKEDSPLPVVPDPRSSFAPGTAAADHFSRAPAAGTVQPFAKGPSVHDNPFERGKSEMPQAARELSVDPFAEGIRKVTPIEDPLMELKEEHRIDLFPDEEGHEASVPDPDDGIMKTIPVGKDNAERSLKNTSGARKDSDPSSRDSVLASGGAEKIEGLTSELKDVKADMKGMLSRFADVNSNVLCLSSGMDNLGSAVAGIKEEGEQRLADTTMRLNSLDGKMVSLEDGLGMLRAENSDIRADLARIEESISELVNSYTALLVQMHESAQESDARFSQLGDAIMKFSPMEDRLRTLERSQGESQSMSMELAKSISSLMDGLGATSADLREFKEAADLDHRKLKENLGLMTEYVDSELRKIGARSYKGYGQNVHLSGITKNSTNMKLCMEWLEFLMGLVGRNNLPDILSYYEELGWITEQVRSELIHYAEGIDFYMEKPDWKLTPDDHVKSIWFIESLAGLKVDKNRLSVIDRDIEKVKKGTEIYGI